MHVGLVFFILVYVFTSIYLQQAQEQFKRYGRHTYGSVPLCDRREQKPSCYSSNNDDNDDDAPQRRLARGAYGSMLRQSCDVWLNLFMTLLLDVCPRRRRQAGTESEREQRRAGQSNAQESCVRELFVPDPRVILCAQNALGFNYITRATIVVSRVSSTSPRPCVQCARCTRSETCVQTCTHVRIICIYSTL